MSVKHALIIDDNQKNISVLARMLQTEGLGVTQVFDPKQVEAAVKSLQQCEVVFLDLEMPQIDGYTVLEQLRADARFAGIPIVAYTVHVSEMNAAYQRGFNGFLGKPLDTDRFPDQLARILSGQPVWETF